MSKGKRIGQGNTSEIYEYGTGKILKLYRAAMPKEACINEFRITQNIYRLLKCCPQSYEIVELDNRIGATYEKITGKTLLSIMLCNTMRIKKLSRQLLITRLNFAFISSRFAMFSSIEVVLRYMSYAIFRRGINSTLS